MTSHLRQTPPSLGERLAAALASGLVGFVLGGLVWLAVVRMGPEPLIVGAFHWVLYFTVCMALVGFLFRAKLAAAIVEALFSFLLPDRRS